MPALTTCPAPEIAGPNCPANEGMAFADTQPAPLGKNRAEERAKALAEIRGAENEALTTSAWIDQGKGIVRLRIEDAMKLVEREWQNPAAARSNLVARVEKATALPPKPPEKPSPFE